MEKDQFLSICENIGTLHFPRWQELPEFELYMDQVIALAEKYFSVIAPDNKGLLTPSMINNYVKSGVLPPPKNKKYNRTHLAMLIIICATKSVLEISAISDIIGKHADAENMEMMLDRFAGMYEEALAAQTAQAMQKIKAAEEDAKQVLSIVAIENAVTASAAHTISLHAYSLIAEKPNEEKTEKSEKSDKTEKKAAKAKKEAEKEEAKRKEDTKTEENPTEPS